MGHRQAGHRRSASAGVSTQDADQVKQTTTRTTRARTPNRRVGFVVFTPWLPLECYRDISPRSRHATLYTESSDSFVASAAASIATGWSEPVPGRELHPLQSSAFHGALSP